MKFDISRFLKSKRKKENRKRNGPWKEFNKQGILVQEGTYVDGVRVGKWKLYYETGELVMEENYVYGNMEGPFKSYYKSGQLLSEGYYHENRREGKFSIYDANGQPSKIMIFKNDILIEEHPADDTLV